MKRLILLLTIISIVALPSCSDDDIKIPNEEELITSLIYTLTPVSGGSSVEFRFQDLDGDGGNAPVITGGILEAGMFYSGSITLLNESVSPSLDISEEVLDEGVDHQLFYEVSSGLEVEISYADQDVDGEPIGLITTLTTSNSSSGQLTITLRHEPDKSAVGVTEGNITNAGGETDIRVTFDVQIE